jgi:hypothetical protein
MNDEHFQVETSLPAPLVSPLQLEHYPTPCGGQAMNTVLLLYHCRRLHQELCTILARKYRVVAAHGAVTAERLLRTRKLT